MSTLRRFYRDTRALSPVVATILLVAIAVIASVLTYLWATGFIGAIQSRPSQATETIHIQGASYTASSGAFTIYVQNAGTQSVSYTQVFLLNTAGTTLATVSVSPPPNAAGVVATVSGTFAGAPIAGAGSGAQIILQITTTKGTSAEITLTAI